MATQASAITFISTPGMGYQTGLNFAQFYFGLPLAMIIVAFAFVPVFHKLKVYTAYEFLENRFSLNARLLTAFLFLVQRGLAAGLTIYAPSIILAKILGFPLYANILVIGILVIIYTVSGGTEAVTQTHKQQMAVIFLGLFIVFGFLVYGLHNQIGLSKAFSIAELNDKLDLVDTRFDLSNRYNIWSGMIAGTFLMLAYFGTDQSQVQRYISGKSVKEIRTGLYFNAVLKIPMQIFILLIGVMVFVFYQVQKPPIFFDHLAIEHVESSEYQQEMTHLKEEYVVFQDQKADRIKNDFDGYKKEVSDYNREDLAYRQKVEMLIEKSSYVSPIKKEGDFVFITYVLKYLPIGLIGLLMAVIFSAAMSSTAAELNALATTTVVDFYKRLRKDPNSKTDIVKRSKLFTALWGVVAISFAMVAQFLDNLVEAVNILGSLFYGTVLGIFLVAFYAKRVGSLAVIISAIIAELFVVSMFVFQPFFNKLFGVQVEFLWYNLIGCFLVFALSLIIQSFLPKLEPKELA